MKSLVCVVGIALMGCSSIPQKANESITYGTTKAQVLGVLGQPHNKQWFKSQEVWQYCYVSGFGQREIRNIWITNGVTIAVSTNLTYTCDQFHPVQFRDIEKVPDQIYEIRQR